MTPSSGALPAHTERWRPTALLVFAVVVVAALPSLPAGVANWDNQVKLQLARGLLAGDGYALTAPTPDDAQYLVRGRDGRAYTGYPPLASVLHVATIAWERLTGRLAEGFPATVLLGLLAATLVSWAQREGASPADAVAGAVLATAGTVLWPTAAHGSDVVIEALALAAVLRAGAGQAGVRDFGLAGLAIGAAVATRLGAATLAVPAAVLLIAGDRRPRALLARGAALAAGAAPGAVAVIAFNVHRFGAPLTVLDGHATATVSSLTVPWFSSAHLEGMAGLLVSPGKGLLWYSPPLIAVALATRPLARRHPRAALAIIAYAATLVLTVGRLRFWHGEWAWGPRYVAPLSLAAAPLAWLVAERVRFAGRALRRGALTALVALVAVQALPVVGRPVALHFQRTLLPLEASGAIVTRPITRPPLPADNRTLYYAPANSMLASLGGGLWEHRGSPRLQVLLWRALLLPALAGALVALAHIEERRRASAAL